MAQTTQTIAEWALTQKALLSDAYDKAWRRGVARYEREEEPEEADGDERDDAGTIARTGKVPYRSPTEPDPERKRQALSTAHASVDRMAAEMSAVATTPMLGLTKPAREKHEREGTIPTAAAGLAAWGDSNMFRMASNLGGAVWGGEQYGYAAGAGANEDLLEWNCEDDATSCGDCVEAGNQPPAPESAWSFFPGGGSTECGGNCRCSMSVVGSTEAAAAAPQGGEAE